MELDQIYGITGIMGSGKSTVANLLKAKGCIILDADNYAKIVLSEKYKKYSKIKREIIKNFQELAIEKLDKPIFSETFDRKALGELVFSDSKLLDKLGEIIHPHVRDLLSKDLLRISSKNLKKKPIFYDVPLLFETNLYKEMKKTVVVYARESTCIKRAQLRTGLSISDIKKRISSQISIEKKQELADYVIDNSKDIDFLKKQINAFYLKEGLK